MSNYLADYRDLLKELVRLQKILIGAFESVVEIIPLDDLPDAFSQLETIVQPKFSISDILSAWPQDIPFIPFLAWVRPRVGVFQVEGNDWMFNIHGAMEVQFVGLPPGLEQTKLDPLYEGAMEVLLDIPGCGPVVESKYYEMDRVYGLTVWSAYEFIKSVNSQVKSISLSDHESLLEKLVQEKFLVSCSGSVLGVTYFVLADDEEDSVDRRYD